MNSLPSLLRAARVAASPRFVSSGTTSLMRPRSLPPHSFCHRLFSGDDSGDTSDVDPSKFTQEIKVRMPDMGEGEGKVLKWYKKEGDVIRRDDILCDIETKDFSFGMVTDDECDAIMGEIKVEAGSEPVEDNALICTLFHEEDDDKKEDDKKEDDKKEDDKKEAGK